MEWRRAIYRAEVAARLKLRSREVLIALLLTLAAAATLIVSLTSGEGRMASIPQHVPGSPPAR